MLRSDFGRRGGNGPLLGGAKNNSSSARMPGEYGVDAMEAGIDVVEAAEANGWDEGTVLLGKVTMPGTGFLRKEVVLSGMSTRSDRELVADAARACKGFAPV